MALARVGSALLVGGSLIYSVANQFYFIVEPGTAVVKFDRFKGVVDEVYQEGFHLIMPFIQRRFLYETRSRYVIVRTTTGTKDLQNVNITLRVLFRPDANSLPKIHQTLGQTYNEVVLPSISNEILKGVVAQFNAEELITKREVVSGHIRKMMSTRAYDAFGIILDDISLIDTSFTEEFAKAVESKQVAQQEAERHKWIVTLNEHIRDAAITKAEGEANAAALISKAMQKYGNALLELRRLETAVAVAKELSQNPHVTYVPQSMNALVPLRSAS